MNLDLIEYLVREAVMGEMMKRDVGIALRMESEALRHWCACVDAASRGYLPRLPEVGWAQGSV